MILRVQTAGKGPITAFVGDSRGALRVLRKLARDGFKCVWWRLED